MNTTPATTPCLGLIGGFGVGATVHYYQEFVKAHSARGSTPHLPIIHADVNRVLTHARDGNITRLAEYLAGLVRQLQGRRRQDSRRLRGHAARLYCRTDPPVSAPAGESGRGMRLRDSPPGSQARGLGRKTTPNIRESPMSCEVSHEVSRAERPSQQTT
jgi:hypothetical protein